MKNRLHIIIALIATLPFLGNSQQLSATLGITKAPTCFGVCNGTASINVSGGSAPYHYKWSNVAGDTSSVNTLCAGTHRVTITDNNNSSVPLQFTLVAPAKLKADTSAHGTTSCFGTIITISASGGTPFNSSTPYKGTGTFNSPPGDYYYVVSDKNGCKDSVPVSIPAANIVKVSVTITDTACFGGTVMATIRATGGFAPYEGIGVRYVSGGVKLFHVQDSLGCATVDTVDVPMFPKTEVTIVTDSVVRCSGDSTFISVTSSFSNYTWSNGATTQSTYSTNGGDFSVTVKDANNCNAESNHLNVEVLPTPQVSVSLKGDTLLAYNATTYQWYHNEFKIEGATTNMYVAKKSGAYAVAITDNNGCGATSSSIHVTTTGIDELNSTKVEVYPNPSPNGVFQVSVTNEMIGGTALVFDAAGKIVYQSEVERNQSSIALDVPSGIYLLRIQNGENVITRRLSK